MDGPQSVVVARPRMTKASKAWKGTPRAHRGRNPRGVLAENEMLREENARLLTKIEYLETDLRAERVAAHQAARRRSYGMAH